MTLWYSLAPDCQDTFPSELQCLRRCPMTTSGVIHKVLFTLFFQVYKEASDFPSKNKHSVYLTVKVSVSDYVTFEA